MPASGRLANRRRVPPALAGAVASAVAGLVKDSYNYAVHGEKHGKRSREADATATKGETGVTSLYHEDKVEFSKKKVARRKIKDVKKRMLRFDKNLMATKAQQTLVRQWNSTLIGSTNSQAVAGVVIYGMNGSSDTASGTTSYVGCGNQDVNFILNACSPIATGSGVITNFNAGYNQGKIGFRSAILDLTITATSNNSMVDIYEVVCRRDVTEASLVSVFEDVTTGVNTSGGASAEGFGNIGFTPFECPVFCQNMVILKKRRHYITSGTSISMQLKDGNEHLFDPGWFNTFQGGGTGVLFGKKGMTKGYLITFVGDLSGITPYQTTASSISLQVLRTYHYAVLGDGTPYTAQHLVT